jgi:hypothetical protein
MVGHSQRIHFLFGALLTAALLGGCAKKPPRGSLRPQLAADNPGEKAGTDRLDRELSARGQRRDSSRGAARTRSISALTVTFSTPPHEPFWTRRQPAGGQS